MLEEFMKILFNLKLAYDANLDKTSEDTWQDITLFTMYTNFIRINEWLRVYRGAGDYKEGIQYYRCNLVNLYILRNYLVHFAFNFLPPISIHLDWSSCVKEIIASAEADLIEASLVKYAKELIPKVPIKVQNPTTHAADASRASYEDVTCAKRCYLHAYNRLKGYFEKPFDKKKEDDIVIIDATKVLILLAYEISEGLELKNERRSGSGPKHWSYMAQEIKNLRHGLAHFDPGHKAEAREIKAGPIVTDLWNAILMNRKKIISTFHNIARGVSAQLERLDAPKAAELAKTEKIKAEAIASFMSKSEAVWPGLGAKPAASGPGSAWGGSSSEEPMRPPHVMPKAAPPAKPAVSAGAGAGSPFRLATAPLEDKVDITHGIGISLLPEGMLVAKAGLGVKKSQTSRSAKKDAIAERKAAMDLFFSASDEKPVLSIRADAVASEAAKEFKDSETEPADKYAPSI